MDYREPALKLFPWICGRCGRAFTHKSLHELTVHHRDHNHDNNPPDGSTWQLLCLYCHDNEHQKQLEAQRAGPAKPQARKVATGNPLADLRELIDKGRK
ncbi:MAG: YajD family HNH nuclease [Nevskiaceae bacterium]